MKKITLSLFILMLIFTSCEDVLDKKPLDIISDATVWSEPVLIDDYLNQCYAEMKFLFEMPYANGYNWFEMTASVSMADEAKFGWVATPQSHWISINGGVMEWWGYPTVRRLNIFLEKLTPMELNEDYKTQRIAEARFLRAFAYFNMVKRYGGVPLITKTQQLDDPEEELYPSRNKEVEIYDFILTELNDIVDDLPEVIEGNDLGRPSKFAVLALKSRAAMYAGSIATWGTVMKEGLVGIPASRADDFWQKSYDASLAIIQSTKFSLYNESPDNKILNFRNLFLDENNSEVIFSERFDGLAGKGHSWDMWNVPNSYNVWAGGQQCNAYLEMVESFDNTDGTSGILDRTEINSGHLYTIDDLWGNKDPRFRASIYTHGTPWSHTEGNIILDYHDGIEHDGQVQTVDSYKGVLARSRSLGRPTPFGVLKYLDEAERNIVHEREHSDTDYIIFRLGEILLNYAEASIELDKDGDALWAVNELRKRAGMQEYLAIDRDKVRKERKCELAFEGNRYWDVRRWRTAVNDLTQDYHGLRFILDGSSFEEGAYNVSTAKYKLSIIEHVAGTPAPYFDEKHYYLPISLSRTGSNPNLDENPGYK